MADFVWNVASAESLRSQMYEMMRSQSENMQDRAKALLDLANNAATRITELQSTLPIGEYEYVRVSEEETDSDGNVTREAQYSNMWVSDHDAEQKVREEIEALNAVIEESRKYARRLSEEAYQLDREIREKNALFQQLYELTQETDNGCAIKIAQIKQDIIYHTNNVINLKDSLGMLGPYGSRYSCIGSMLATSQTFAAQWNWVNGTLAKQADDITSAEFGKLAWWFTKQTDIVGQERFLNAFLEPGFISSRSIRTGNPTHFTICPQKVAGVQWYLEMGNVALLFSQMNLQRGSVEYRLHEAERDRLKGLSALLTAINSLTDHGRHVVGFPLHPEQASKRVIIPVGDGSVISLASNISGGNTITVGLGTVHPSETGGHFILNAQGRGLFNRRPERSTINISQVLCGYMLSDRNLSNSTSFFYLQHQFDLASHIAGWSVDLMVSAATLGMKPAASIITSIASSIVQTPEAAREAASIQNDFVVLYNLLRHGQFQRDFDLRGVIIEHEGTPPQIHSWPTIYTPAALDALRNLVEADENLRNATESNFTLQEFLQNPTEIFRVYSDVLNSDQRREVYRRLEAYQLERFINFRQQEQEEVSRNEGQNNNDSHGNMHNPEHDTGDTIR